MHADEQFSLRRGREAIAALADGLISAGQAQGFDREQIEAEIGDIFRFIEARITSENVGETSRLRGEHK